MKLNFPKVLMQIRLTCCFALLLCLLRATYAAPNVFAEEAATKTLLTAVLVDASQAPVIDGKLDDAAWQRASEVTGFSQIAPGNLPSKFPTYVRFLYDARNLYIGFRCVQTKSTLKLNAAPDGEVWNDDCIELFLTPDIKNGQLQTLFAADQHYHLIFNAAGTKFDELGNGGAASWNGNWDVKTSIGENEWQAEVKIPFADVSHKEVAPWPFQSWSLQIARSLAQDGERATLFTPQGLYRNHAAFGFLVFVDKPQDEATVRWNIDKGNFVTPRLTQLRETIAALKPEPAFRARLAALAARVPQLAAQFAEMPPSTYSTAARAEYFGRISQLERELRDLQEQMVLQRMKSQGNISGIALAPHPPVLDSQLVKPDFLPELERIGQPVKVSVTAGQYQAASVVLWTKSAQSNVLVKAAPLKGETKVAGKKKLPGLASQAIDVRWVKCWYQAGNNEVVRGPSVLTPELLLKNPDLVTVDLKAEKNITFITPEMEERDYPGDAKELLPQKKIEADTSTQVWLTINVPSGTPAGLYRSTLDVVSGNKKLAALPIEVTVLDFELAPSMMQHAWYARTMWGGSRWGQTRERALAEAQNMARHGVTHVGMIEESWELPKAVGVMREAGLSTDTL
jgi:hypothetical protein